MGIGNQVHAQCFDERRRERATRENSELVGELQTVLGAGQGAEAVRPIRDEIERRVRDLIDELTAA